MDNTFGVNFMLRKMMGCLITAYKGRCAYCRECVIKGILVILFTDNVYTGIKKELVSMNDFK